MRKQLLIASALPILLLLPLPAAEAGLRSPAIRAEFKRLHPCPANGRTRGACPGFQIDHREALICGGKDDLSNLQWLSVEDHKAKTRVEVKLCRTHVR